MSMIGRRCAVRSRETASMRCEIWCQAGARKCPETGSPFLGPFSGPQNSSQNSTPNSQVCYFASFFWGRFPAPETGTQMEVQSGPAPLVKNGGWSPGESPLPAISQPACPDTARSAAHSPASPFLFPSAIRWRARAPPRGLRWIGSARKRIRIPGKIACTGTSSSIQMQTEWRGPSCQPTPCVLERNRFERCQCFRGIGKQSRASRMEALFVPYGHPGRGKLVPPPGRLSCSVILLGGSVQWHCRSREAMGSSILAHVSGCPMW